MTESNIIWRFLVCAFTVCRLTPSLAGEKRAGYRTASHALWPDFGLYCLVVCFRSLNFWISLPIAIWLSSGWVGLLMQWQSIAGPNDIRERSTPSNLSRRPR